MNFSKSSLETRLGNERVKWKKTPFGYDLVIQFKIYEVRMEEDNNMLHVVTFFPFHLAVKARQILRFSVKYSERMSNDL